MINNIYSVPDICIAYTSVFQNIRLEHGITMLIGLIIGIASGYLNK